MNVSELIASVKLLGSIPENQVQFSDDNILMLCTDELHERLIPFITNLNSDYLLFDHSFQTVIGQRDYRLPRACLYGSIRDIFDAASRSLIPIDPTVIRERSFGFPTHYYFTGPKLSFYPTPTAAVTITLRCLAKAATLKKMEYHAPIASIDTVLNQITFAAMPSIFIPNVYVDIQKPTSSFEIEQMSNKITGASGVTITLETPIKSTVAVGDYVSIEGTAAFPNVPEELHSTLALCGASRCLMSLGQLDQKAAIDKRIDENLARFKQNMWPRSRGEGERIVSPYI